MKVLIVLALTLIGTKVSTAEDEADIIFVLDGSGSLSDNHFALQQEFAANVSAAFKVGQTDKRFAAFVYSTDATLLFDFDEFSTNQEISQALWTAPFQEGIQERINKVTHQYRGLYLAYLMTQNARPTAAKVVVYIIMEETSGDPTDAINISVMMEETNVTTLAVSIGDASQTELLSIAWHQDHIFKVGSYEDIGTLTDAVIEKIFEVTRRNPTSGNPQPPCPNGEVVGSQCLTLSCQKMTKADATQSCAANNGGKIFEIRSEELYIQLGGIAKKNGLRLWAGAEEAAEGDWKWISDNSSASIPEEWFKRGEPNNWRGNEECLQMRPNGKLNDAHCDKRFHFVCVN